MRKLMGKNSDQVDICAMVVVEAEIKENSRQTTRITKIDVETRSDVGCRRVRIRAEDLVIREVHRVEGVSDPDDMAIVYGIEGRRGLKATVVDAFGVYSDPALSALLERVAIREAA